MGKKLIAYSLYGTNKFYSDGAIRNVKDAKLYYPGWICRIYVSQEVPGEIIKELEDLGAEVVNKERKDYADGMFWRFLPMSEENVDITLVRDTDSVITKREVDAVMEWIKSEKVFHIMRDHPYHRALIVGCSFGSKKNIIPNISKMIDEWGYYNKRGADQEFLKYKIYPLIKNNVMIHTELVCYKSEEIKSFPSPRIPGEFVGCHKRAFELTDVELKNYLDIFLKAKMREYAMPFTFWQRIKAKILLELVHWHREIRNKLSLL